MTGEESAGRDDAVRLARIALTLLVEPGNQALWARVATHGPVLVLEGLLRSGFTRVEHPLRRAAGARLDGADPWKAAEQSIRRADRLGARVVIPEDAEWPAQLEQLIGICVDRGDPIDRDAAPPLCLWVRGPGRLDDTFRKSVAVVGARAATGYGAHVARQLGYELAVKDWTVVAGGAFGIDAHAHRGALAAGRKTVAVLACGVDVAYPAGHASLFERIAEDGLLISEWPPGAEPFRHRFLIRNRVIAAATAGTVVVEASARSGSLQTLRRAGELSRRRMVVPGPVTSALSVGCHEQLRDPEVRLVTGSAQVLEEVGKVGELAPVPRGPERPRDHLRPVEQRLVEALLKRKPLSAEEVAARAGVSVRDAMRALPDLVARGFATSRGSGFVVAQK